MFLKDLLKDTYQKASLDKNTLVLEKLIMRWAHRFGVDSLNELTVKNQDQIQLIEEDQEVKNQDQIQLIEEDQEVKNQGQINFEILENVQSQVELDFKSNKRKKSNNTEIINRDIYESDNNNSQYMDREELPLPNINNLRKWINNEKKAS